MGVLECQASLDSILAEEGVSTFWYCIKKMKARRLEVADRPKRVRLSPAKRMKLYWEQDGICHVCNKHVEPRDNWHIDHRDPNLGGEAFNAWSNLAIAHAGCNTSKGALSIPAQAKRYNKPMTALI